MYTKEIKRLDETLFSQMRVCSYDLQCEQFDLDFVASDAQELYVLQKNSHGLFSYFPVLGAEKYIMELSYKQEAYLQHIGMLKKSIIFEYLGVLVIVLILSTIFSLYALYPLRNALILTQEFIKDILHDFNTPLASIRLNTSMLKREQGDNEKIARIDASVQNVLDLQENLRAYLYNHELQKEIIDMKALVAERIAFMQKSYDHIQFSLEMQATYVTTNKEALTRILDNLLSNSAKYNKKNGAVSVRYETESEALIIEDTGKGIAQPKRIFERFYKEHARGIGIGLHIVKKLCDELNIDISVTSTVGEGTSFRLTFR